MLYVSFLIGLLLGAPAGVPTPVLAPPAFAAEDVLATSVSFEAEETPATDKIPSVPDVPFYSQLTDIHVSGWQKIGCGIASLAMIIEYYHPAVVTVDALLHEGIAAGAYAKNAGWKHRDLVQLGGRHGLSGESYDLAQVDMASAFAQFTTSLARGPVIASVRYEFDPQSTIPHLVVITGIEGGRVYFNDPAAKLGGQYISVATFQQAWKKRFIAFEPAA